MKKGILILLVIASFGINAFAQKYRVKITTDYGTIKVTLYDSTPLNTANMVKLAKAHGYDSTLFHRVIPAFMIQGGDPDSKQAKPGQMLGNGGLTYTVPAEIKDAFFHKRGALGVARDNNPEKAGSASQFYIVVGRKFSDEELNNLAKKNGHIYTQEQRDIYKTIGGTPHLDGNYTVFGEVTDGMDIVDKIVMEPRDKNDRPNKDIHILKLRVKKKKRFFFF